MKRILLIASLLASLYTADLFAQQTDWSAGLVLGEPTGLVIRKELNEPLALHGTFAWSFGSYFASALDAVYYFKNIAGFPPELRRNLSFYVGGGAIVLVSLKDDPGRDLDATGDMGLGLRIPLGIEWQFRPAPVSVFLEIAPAMGLYPGTFGFFNAGLGAVYKF
jgi:hypothetical protein